ncbi:MAG: MATE family efflux transporter, partial [Bacilli bacterium]|nr:MATE family efflux transporter [Bacilli bacterium]
IAYTVISFFQAVGKAWRSLILALLRKGILDIPLMFILQIYIPIYGIVWATPIADIACCVIALVLFFVYLKLHGQNKGEFAKTIEDN